MITLKSTIKKWMSNTKGRFITIEGKPVFVGGPSQGAGGSSGSNKPTISGEPNKETLNAIVSQYNATSEEFPFIKGQLKEIDFDGSDYGTFFEYDPQTNKLTMLKSLSKFPPETLDQVVDGWAEKLGTVKGGFTSIVNHEMGHIIRETIRDTFNSTGRQEQNNIFHDSLFALRSRLGLPSTYSGRSIGEWVSERFAFERMGNVEPVLTNELKKWGEAL